LLGSDSTSESVDNDDATTKNLLVFFFWLGFHLTGASGVSASSLPFVHFVATVLKTSPSPAIQPTGISSGVLGPP